MRILLVEDDDRLGNIISHVLVNKGFDVDWAKDGEEVFYYIDYSKDNIYDVIVLDWMLPIKSGPEICKELRTKYAFDGGILFLTAKDALEDKIVGLEAGSDDYVVKPFENDELIARIKALARRKGRPYIEDKFSKEDVVLDRKQRAIMTGNLRIQLSQREYKIFDLLFTNLGKIIPRETIIARVWGDEAEVTSANLDSYIYILRKKLKDIDNLLSISLVRGLGYKIEKKKNDR